ncbi:FtsJ-domain-containing protein [Boletus reticuloceps]|uniref:FtsJ-domain-containing protein n=1 Tax=Boletus reticuloceps TaxID=495285 RepID=A0A8I2Z0S6_9AGAM|nr:FtsJ-domain-containing protein [Boletus reticuloceps]
MGKAKKKTGKGRLDKYYKLAKEQGYRARSAFKLIQLNKKYDFLESARCCIDLCAAPGGWLQVASKYMPTNSVIVGVDLVPIKPIPRVVTFVADITTVHCRNLLRGELKDWKADVVLHDGAPNVGTAWVQDAYAQSELVLMSLKLAVGFLAKGGTFITKVFRSADYNNLIWVFSQLFAKVEATKPPSSRDVSAEIFVVCREFLAPKHIDPKFLDPKHVFKDPGSALSGHDKGSSANNALANVFQPEKKRRRRDGYDDGDYTLFTKTSASEFVHNSEPVSVLGLANKITFETEEEKRWLGLGITTPDIKVNFEDLKVLGKGDFKALLKWRIAVREELGLEVRTKPTAEFTEAVEISEVVDEEQQIQEELERRNAEAAAKEKRSRRRTNEIKTKTIQRLQLQMTAPLDIGLEQNDASLSMGQDDDVFDLVNTQRELRKRGGISKLVSDEEMPSDEEEEVEEMDGSEEEAVDSEEERERRISALEADLDSMYNAYREKAKERNAKYRVEAARKEKGQLEEWGGLKGEDDESGNDSSEDGGWEVVAAAKGVGDPSSDESDYDEPISGWKRKRANPAATKCNDAQPPSRATQVWFSQDIFKEVGEPDDDDEHEHEHVDMVSNSSLSLQDDQGDKSSASDFEIVPAESRGDTDMWDVDGDNVDQAKQAHIQTYGLTTAEAVTLAQQLVSRRTTKTHLLNDGFNRYSLNDKEGLPSWFLDNEAKHYKPNVPITKEAVAILRARQRALDSRPIKKIAEAKGRKKLRTAQRVERAIKRAEGVNATAEMSEREKAQQIEKLMRKGMAKGKKTEVKVIVAKGAHKGIKGRPRGVKGRYAMVDARMKKEVRAKKRSEKAKGNGGRRR